MGSAGDEILLDYLPGRGTGVTVNGVERGVIAGKDFNDALLAVWPGEAPVSAEFKAALLGR